MLRYKRTTGTELKWFTADGGRRCGAAGYRCLCLGFVQSLFLFCVQQHASFVCRHDPLHLKLLQVPSL